VEHTKGFGGLLLAAALAASAPLPASADDIFLKLTDVKGESLDARHPGEIEILSYTQSMTGPFAPGATSGAAAGGKTTCGAVTITKYVDASSPDLILAAANGRHYPTAVITFRRTGQTPFEYYTVTLDDAIVTGVEQSGSRSSSTQRVVEKVSLIGRAFRFEYTAQQPTTGGIGARPKAGWDCVANKKI
jgi:type VI secretion system secreted protein Hcp